MDAPPASLKPRQTARVILHDGRGRVWLLKGLDPGRPERLPFWFTPGGKIEADESAEEAACREVMEETGLALTPADLGPVIGTEDTVYSFCGETYHQTSVFFAVLQTGPINPDTSGYTEIEREAILTARWWDRAELDAATEEVFPVDLGAMLDKITPPA